MHVGKTEATDNATKIRQQSSCGLSAVADASKSGAASACKGTRLYANQEPGPPAVPAFVCMVLASLELCS